MQSRQEKRSRAEQERKEEKEKKKMSGACAGVRERKTRSEREGQRGAGGNHSNVSLYILRFVLLAGYANFRPHRYPSRTKVPSPLYTRSLHFSLSPSLTLSVAIESEKFAKVRSRDAGVGVVVGSVIKICASKQT